jgi:hypothetical protein
VAEPRRLVLGIHANGSVVLFEVDDPKTVLLMVQKRVLTLAKVEVSPGSCNRN